jgi:hypothetical protein
MQEQPSHKLHCIFALQLMFPNPQHAPAEGAERAGDEAVAGAVELDRVAPEGGVGFGLRGVLRASVPEAAIDEEGELAAGRRRRE